MESFIIKFYRFLFARTIFYKFNRLLYHCSLRGLGILNYENHIVSGEYRFLSHYLRGKVKPVVIDIGANQGCYTESVFRVAQDATVYSFEPHPLTYSALVGKEGIERATKINKAVGDKAGHLKLYDYKVEDGSAHASIYKDVIEEIHGADSVSHDVEIITLDEFAELNISGKIDLIKIDTEGNELRVLRGAEKLIRTKSVDAFHFEFNEMNVASRAFFRDFFVLLKDYQLFRLMKDGMIEIPSYSPLHCEIFAYQNIVAIKTWH